MAKKVKRSAKKTTQGKKKAPSPQGQRALSIRQPWAWLIVNGYKDIENRVWPTKVRGRILIHAGAKPVNQADYDYFVDVCRQRRIKDFPDRKCFDLGGIVGSAELVDCVDTSRSYWFGGPYGFVLKNARKSRFKPLKGMLGFLAVAEDEAVRISERTKAALAAAKRRGKKLGSARPGHWDGKEDRRTAGAHKGGEAAAIAHKQAADEVYEHLMPLVTEMQAGGKSLQAIADELNDMGHTTRRGKPWNRMQVSRVLRRAA